MTEFINNPNGDTPVVTEIQSEASKPYRFWAIVGGLLLLALIVGGVFAVIALVNNPDQTETIRDIVIIFMAVESLVIGLVLIILIVQLAQLTTLLRNEVKPILDSTNETLGTVRGTTAFLSDNLVKPVVRVNSAVAALRRAFELVRFRRPR